MSRREIRTGRDRLGQHLAGGPKTFLLQAIERRDCPQQHLVRGDGLGCGRRRGRRGGVRRARRAHQRGVHLGHRLGRDLVLQRQQVGRWPLEAAGPYDLAAEPADLGVGRPQIEQPYCHADPVTAALNSPVQHEVQSQLPA